MHASTSGILPS
jgi:hypothetical protein